MALGDPVENHQEAQAGVAELKMWQEPKGFKRWFKK